MKNKGKRAFIFNAAIGQIFLLLSLTFSVSILLSEEVNASLDYAVGLSSSTSNAAPAITNTPASASWWRTPLNPDGSVVGSSGGASGTGGSGGILNYVGKIAKGQSFGGGVTGALVQGVFWGGILYMAAKWLLPMFGADENTTNAAANALLVAGIAGGAIKAIALQTQTSMFGLTAGQLGFWGGLGIGVIVFLLLYKKEKTQTIQFQCLPWEPKLGGADCERCNDDPFRPCTEYRCRSLGQACRLLNPNTAEPQCAFVGRNDVNSPKIIPKTETLYPKDINLRYIPDTSIRPPNIGVNIISDREEGCLPAFTPLQFGFDTDEPAQCKIDYNHTANYSDMQFYVGGSNYYTYNHTQTMKLPGASELSPMLQNDGRFSLFVRCRDGVEEKNGNAMIEEYVFSFCVDEGPDTSPPVIEGFSIPSGNYVQFNRDNVSMELYVNEPSECRWSTQDKDYNTMENAMACGTESYQINAELNYVCSTTLTGIKNRESNPFYFRCIDQPELADTEQESDRNPNRQSIPYTLIGSRPLDIIDVSPNGTILGSTEVISVDIEVETANGAQENGNATCLISFDGTRDSYSPMFETQSYRHKQTYSNLIGGNYTFFFRCLDAGGNVAESNTTFEVEVDKSSPIITRAYRNKDALQIVTDEDAECVYAPTGNCNYQLSDAKKMSYLKSEDKTVHLAEWKDNGVYYIKCIDLYDNQPDESKCSMIVRSIDLEKEINTRN
ncbi:MAG: hypothetical protein Q8Q31_00185 [Nanoarchaeota archaeon]|nr:hypothetical protein [Nanoarchaeota archaeon]